jgi:hypothetical protein
LFGVDLQATKNGAILVIVNLVVTKLFFDHHMILINKLLVIEKNWLPFKWQPNPVLVSIGKTIENFQSPTIWQLKPFLVVRNYNCFATSDQIFSRHWPPSVTFVESFPKTYCIFSKFNHQQLKFFNLQSCGNQKKVLVTI